MDAAVVERLKEEIRYEFAREGPPEGFPKFPDIPAGRYRDPAFFELEMQYLWPRVWLYATRQEELPEPGSYFVWERVRASLLLVRGDDRQLRAFYNRGAGGTKLVEPPDDSHLYIDKQFDSAGNNLKIQQEFPRRKLEGGVIRDPSTGCIYDLQGRLITDPGTAPAGMQPLPHLEEVRCETWAGWVFVNRDPGAPALLDWLRPIPEQMDEFQGESLRMIDRRWTIIPCNWKVTVEAFQEVYHFKHIHHKGGVSVLDQRGATMGILPNGHSRMITPLTKRMAEMLGLKDPTDWRMDTQRGGFGAATGVIKEIKTVNAMVRNTSTAFSAFPNLVTPVSPTGMPFLLAWPIDVRTTLFEWVTFCLDWGDGPSPVTAPEWKAKLDGFDIVMEEDTRNMAPMQKSLESPGLTGMPVSYQERRIWNCAEQLDRMIGPERIPPELRVPQLLAPYVER
jgi:phenylpropionate dioxygenase-like ring-hydroxylating dioxygenase large terminal subunit